MASTRVFTSKTRIIGRYLIHKTSAVDLISAMRFLSVAGDLMLTAHKKRTTQQRQYLKNQTFTKENKQRLLGTMLRTQTATEDQYTKEFFKTSY